MHNWVLLRLQYTTRAFIYAHFFFLLFHQQNHFSFRRYLRFSFLSVSFLFFLFLYYFFFQVTFFNFDSLANGKMCVGCWYLLLLTFLSFSSFYLFIILRVSKTNYPSWWTASTNDEKKGESIRTKYLRNTSKETMNRTFVKRKKDEEK